MPNRKTIAEYKREVSSLQSKVLEVSSARDGYKAQLEGKIDRIGTLERSNKEIQAAYQGERNRLRCINDKYTYIKAVILDNGFTNWLFRQFNSTGL